MPWDWALVALDATTSKVDSAAAAHIVINLLGEGEYSIHYHVGEGYEKRKCVVFCYEKKNQFSPCRAFILETWEKLQFCSGCLNCAFFANIVKVKTKFLNLPFCLFPDTACRPMEKPVTSVRCPKGTTKTKVCLLWSETKPAVRLSLPHHIMLYQQAAEAMDSTSLMVETKVMVNIN